MEIGSELRLAKQDEIEEIMELISKCVQVMQTASEAYSILKLN